MTPRMSIIELHGMLTNTEILDKLMKHADAQNDHQFAQYLGQKYGLNIERQQILQFRKSSTVNLIHILLREALEP
jgi:hypothetical protein